MKKAKKVLAIIIVLNIILSLFPGLTLVAYAASDLQLTAETVADGNVKISWSPESNTVKTTISYHDSSSTDPNNLVTKDVTTTSYTLTGLKSDYVYDIKVELKDSTDTVLNTGYLYLIPSISLYASPDKPTNISAPDTSGGKESGDKPRLNLRWNVPKIWVSGSFIPMDNSSALTQISTALGSTVNTVNYRINVSTDSTNLDEKASITVKKSGSNYINYVGSNASVTSTVKQSGSALSFTLAGGSEAVDTINNILPDSDILPGSVYYMNVKASFANDGTDVRGLTVMQTGSSIAGSVPYVYTPIRFKLSRDAANNIYVQIYKINQGKLTLPGMYYEVQSNTTDDTNGWTRKAEVNDSYFPNGSAYTVTIISGMNVNSTFYYRVVVRTETSGTNNSLESCAVAYTLSADTSRPPIPTNIAVTNKELNVGTVSTGSVEKTTDVTISWDKPSNWNEIKANHTAANDIYYHLLLNTVQTDTPGESPMLEANGKNYGQFSLKYRLVDCFNANLININSNGIFWEDGNRLYYKIDGRKLFNNDQVLYNGGSYSRTTTALTNTENYPDYLLPNKVYYFQMYTTKGTANTTNPSTVTDRSITSSFTTLSGMELDVPSVEGLKANIHDPNFIELQFMKNTTLDWKDYTNVQSSNNKLYYDIYMNTETNTNTFVRVGTTENLALGDVTFTGLDAGSTYIKAGISQFTIQALINRFGLKIKPNTTYYFLVKTRMHIDGVSKDRESAFTAILPVTTDKGGVQPPDDSAKKPIAPTDFNIATDASGNQLVSGSSVTFSWAKKENNVVYRLICTSSRVAVDAPLSTLQTDSIYQNFQSNFGTILLNPASAKTPATASSSDKFIYDPVTKTFTYKIDTWLFPNRLYYFTLRAEVIQGGATQSSSAWVSIPVTTSLINAPDSLQPVSDCQLGFFWTDNGSTLKAEDYKVKLKGPDDADFKLLSRSQYTVVADGSVFYGRIMNLKPNTSYTVRVFKGEDPNLDMVDEFAGLRTRDANNQIDVKWRGLTVDDYSRYEIAIKTEQASQYTTLDSSDMEMYIDKSGNGLPYYLDKTIGTAGTNYSVYYARIKSIPVMSNGSIVHRPLSSNTKYYIKVRYVRVAPTDATMISYSKYIGPVNTRTEFNQGDYDQNDQDTKNQATFTDKIKELEQNLFWRMNIDNGSTNKLLIKGQRLINLLENSGSSPYVLDISSVSGSASTDVIYMPFSVTSELDSGNKSLIIKTASAEYTIRPNMVDSQGTSDVNALRSTSGVKDVFIKMVINRLDYAPLAIPSRTKAVSKINDLSMQAIGTSLTDKQLSDQINDYLYNSETGLVKKSLDKLADPDNPGNKGTPQQVDSYIKSVIQDVENSLSNFVGTTVEGTGLGTGISLAAKELTSFKIPVRVKMFYNNDSGLKTPYVLYNGSSTWQKLVNNIQNGSNTLSFDVSKTGKYAILATQTSTQDVASDYWAKDYIDRFMSKFDVSDVFAGISTSFNPESDVSVKELVLLYEKVLGKSEENKGMDIKQKAASLGLSGVLNTSNTSRQINRQEGAAVLVKLYAAKMGLNAETLKPGKNIYIKDERSIDNAYYKYVVECVDLGAMSLDTGGNFLPKESVSRAEMVVSMVKLLGTAGEM